MTDNGGAVAISGFNYQATSVIYTILQYRDNDTFIIYPEADEDFQFEVNNAVYFVQVKGEEDLSISKLKKRERVDNQDRPQTSIIEKNYSKGSINDNHWIFLYDWNSAVSNRLDEDYSHGKFKPLLKYTSQQLERITEDLEIEEVGPVTRVTNQRVYKTNFNKNSENSFRLLKSLLAETFDNNIRFTDAILSTINSELWTLVNQKSEKKITDRNDENQYKEKVITQEHVEDICEIVDFESYFEEILTNLDFNTAKKKRIKREKLKNDTLYSSLIQKVLSEISIEKYEELVDEGSEENIIDFFKNEINIKSTTNIGNINELTAIAIECYATRLSKE